MHLSDLFFIHQVFIQTFYIKYAYSDSFLDSHPLLFILF